MLVSSFWRAASTHGVVGGAWAASITSTMLVIITPGFTLRALALPVHHLLRVSWRSYVYDIQRALLHIEKLTVLAHVA